MSWLWLMPHRIINGWWLYWFNVRPDKWHYRTRDLLLFLFLFAHPCHLYPSSYPGPVPCHSPCTLYSYTDKCIDLRIMYITVMMMILLSLILPNVDYTLLLPSPSFLSDLNHNCALISSSIFDTKASIGWFLKSPPGCPWRFAHINGLLVSRVNFPLPSLLLVPKAVLWLIMRNYPIINGCYAKYTQHRVLSRCLSKFANKTDDATNHPTTQDRHKLLPLSVCLNHFSSFTETLSLSRL